MRDATDHAARPGIDRKARQHGPAVVASIAFLVMLAGRTARGQDGPPPDVLAESVLTEVEFRGRVSVGLSEIEARSGLKMDAKVDVFRVVQAVDEIRKLYREKGFPSAEVKLAEGGNPRDSRLVIEIVEGPKALSDPSIVPTAVANLIGTDAMPVGKVIRNLPYVPSLSSRKPDDSFANSSNDFPEVTDSVLQARAIESVEHLTRANDAYQGGKNRLAVREATEAIRARPDLVDAYRFRGEVLGSMRLHRQAIADFDEVLGRDPDDAASLIFRGFYRCMERDFQNGFADLRRGRSLVRNQPDRLSADRWLAMALARRGELRSAVSILDRIIALQPGEFFGHRNRGTSLVALGEYDRGIADLDRAIEIQPDPEVWHTLGEAHFRKGEYALAQVDHERALASSPENAEYCRGHGRTGVIDD